MTMSQLDVRDLTVRFGGLTALNQFSFSLSTGEFLGLIGPNGSGKTTFFNALTGLYRVSEGKIVLDGIDVTGKSPQKIYETGITRTFQRLRLAIPLTVFDNLMIGNYKNLEVGLLPSIIFRNRFKNDLEKMIDLAEGIVKKFSPALVNHLFKPITQLSMIDRRRVEVCRALISKPRLLLLDEPSAGMTEEETRAFMDDLLLTRQDLPNLSIILIEHEMGIIDRLTDRCLVLNYGKKIAEGSYREVSESQEVKRAYLGQD